MTTPRKDVASTLIDGRRDGVTKQIARITLRRAPAQDGELPAYELWIRRIVASLFIGAWLTSLAGGETKKTDEEEGEPKLSLPTEADRQAWTRPGFRLGLAFGYGEFAGLRGAPSGRLLAATLRAGVRLDPTWSLLASFRTRSRREPEGSPGCGSPATIDPTWHVTPSLSVALGFGFGGIVETSSTRMDASPLPGELETSYTFPDASTPMAACSGVGAAGLARVEYAYVIGPRSAASLSLEVIGQWTGCVADTGRVEPDTGDAIVRRQWWPHTGATLALGVTWR